MSAKVDRYVAMLDSRSKEQTRPLDSLPNKEEYEQALLVIDKVEKEANRQLLQRKKDDRLAWAQIMDGFARCVYDIVVLAGRAARAAPQNKKEMCLRVGLFFAELLACWDSAKLCLHHRNELCCPSDLVECKEIDDRFAWMRALRNQFRIIGDPDDAISRARLKKEVGEAQNEIQCAVLKPMIDHYFEWLMVQQLRLLD